jgi:hypothetical protein
MLRGNAVDLRTVLVTAARQAEEIANVVQREAEFAAAPNEPEPLQVLAS